LSTQTKTDGLAIPQVNYKKYSVQAQFESYNSYSFAINKYPLISVQQQTLDLKHQWVQQLTDIVCNEVACLCQKDFVDMSKNIGNYWKVTLQYCDAVVPDLEDFAGQDNICQVKSINEILTQHEELQDSKCAINPILTQHEELQDSKRAINDEKLPVHAQSSSKLINWNNDACNFSLYLFPVVKNDVADLTVQQAMIGNKVKSLSQDFLNKHMNFEQDGVFDLSLQYVNRQPSAYDNEESLAQEEIAESYLGQRIDELKTALRNCNLFTQLFINRSLKQAKIAFLQKILEFYQAHKSCTWQDVQGIAQQMSGANNPESYLKQICQGKTQAAVEKFLGKLNGIKQVAVPRVSLS
jgi:hypothetical protein